MMTDIRDYKVCAVCANKAYGKNFGAITCDPCKAFFRRNATKNKFECLFDGKCSINQITRKFCQKCRLEKCFSVGMKKEFILNEEEKNLRRVKIEANRRRRKLSLNMSIDSDSNSLDADETRESFQNFDSISGLEDMTSDLTIENDFLIEALQNNNISVDDINEQIMEIENSIMGEDDTTDVAHDVYLQTVDLELSILPIERPIPDNPQEFNSKEMEILIELLNANRLWKSPLQKSYVKEIGNMAELREALTSVYDQEIKNLVRLSKSLRSFNTLCENDRICLLKNHCFPALLMRAIKCYNFDTNYWILYMDENTSILVKMELLKHFRYELYEAFQNYFRKFLSIWDSDSVIVDLLTIIQLFDVKRTKDLIHKENVKLQQHIYMHLLQRYLKIKYRSDCESKSKFLKLMNTLIDLNVLGEIQKRCVSTRSPQQMGPLLIEIMDVHQQKPISIA